jgi:2-methylisocitrate lyase-like PEP mutase family enzyme
VDFEAGYGAFPEAVAANVRAVIDAGVAGIDLEDDALYIKSIPWTVHAWPQTP